MPLINNKIKDHWLQKLKLTLTIIEDAPEVNIFHPREWMEKEMLTRYLRQFLKIRFYPEFKMLSFQEHPRLFL